MKKYDFLSGLFLLALSIAICIGSSKLNVGTLTAPGSGFFPLMTGIGLGVFSILILIEARKSKKEDVRFWAPNANKKEIYLTFGLILVYALLLERLGFTATSLIFFFLISRLVFYLKWTTSILFALVASFGTYFVFTILLHAPLPQGLLERVF
jgi:hypothetical protein